MCNQLEHAKVIVGIAAINNSKVLLGTTPVEVLDRDVREHDCRTLLDSCSLKYFISQRLVNKEK